MLPDKKPNPSLRELRLMPLCILCAKNPEAYEMAKALGIEKSRLNGEDVEEVNNGHVFYLGELTLQSGELLKYYVTSGLRQGIQSFTVHAALLLHILKPRYVIHAGVCAGYRDNRRKIGDVIFGEAAVNYQEGKLDVDSTGGIIFIPDYNRVQIEAGDMKAFAEQPSRSLYHYGEYISGSSLRKDATSLIEKARANNQRNVIALDMEASAFLQLCKHSESQGPMCLGVVKGVSDYGDDSRDGSTKEADYYTALRNTGTAVKEWILYRIPSISWEINESNEPGAHILKGFYDNFVYRVCENYMQAMSITDKNDKSIEIPHGHVKGFKVILPENRDPHLVKDLSVIQPTINRYGIQEVTIGGGAYARILHYKAGYFIDWSRCINTLIEHNDYSYQVDVFARQLQKKNFFQASGQTPAFAQVVDWIDAIKWLEQVAKEEAAQAACASKLGVAATPVSNAESTESSSRGDTEGRPSTKPVVPVRMADQHSYPLIIDACSTRAVCH